MVRPLIVVVIVLSPPLGPGTTTVVVSPATGVVPAPVDCAGTVTVNVVVSPLIVVTIVSV